MELKYVALSKIKPDPNQPRKHFDEDSIKKLAKSIKKIGILAPIIVDQDYKILFGERRYRAYKLLGMRKRIPVIVKRIDPKERLLFQLVEDLHKEQYPPIDLAKAIKSFMEANNLSLRKTASILGISRWKISDLFDLLKFPKEIQDLVNQGKIPRSIIAEISKAPPEHWQNLVKIYLKKKATHRQIRDIVISLKDKDYDFIKKLESSANKLIAMLNFERIIKLDEKYRQRFFSTLNKLYEKIVEIKENFKE